MTFEDRFPGSYLLELFASDDAYFSLWLNIWAILFREAILLTSNCITPNVPTFKKDNKCRPSWVALWIKGPWLVKIPTHSQNPYLSEISSALVHRKKLNADS